MVESVCFMSCSWCLKQSSNSKLSFRCWFQRCNFNIQGQNDMFLRLGVASGHFVKCNHQTIIYIATAFGMMCTMLLAHHIKNRPLLHVYMSISHGTKTNTKTVMLITILQLETQLIFFPIFSYGHMPFFLLSLNMYSIPVSKY